MSYNTDVPTKKGWYWTRTHKVGPKRCDLFTEWAAKFVDPDGFKTPVDPRREWGPQIASEPPSPSIQELRAA